MSLECFKVPLEPGWYIQWPQLMEKDGFGRSEMRVVPEEQQQGVRRVTHPASRAAWHQSDSGLVVPVTEDDTSGCLK